MSDELDRLRSALIAATPGPDETARDRAIARAMKAFVRGATSPVPRSRALGWRRFLGPSVFAGTSLAALGLAFVLPLPAPPLPEGELPSADEMQIAGSGLGLSENDAEDLLMEAPAEAAAPQADEPPAALAREAAPMTKAEAGNPALARIETLMARLVASGDGAAPRITLVRAPWDGARLLVLIAPPEIPDWNREAVAEARPLALNGSWEITPAEGAEPGLRPEDFLAIPPGAGGLTGGTAELASALAGLGELASGRPDFAWTPGEALDFVRNLKGADPARIAETILLIGEIMP